MTDCSGCGNCCDPVRLPVSPADIALMRDVKMSNRKIAADRRTATNRTLGWMLGLELLGRRWNGKAMSYLYRCPSFDTETRRCNDYSIRPETCRNYPWYGKEPHLDVSMGAQCSFIADVPGITMLPIVAVT